MLITLVDFSRYFVILHELQKVVNWIFFYFLFSFPMCIDMLNEFQRAESFHSTQTGFPLFFNDYQLHFLYQRLYWNKDFPFKKWIHTFFHKVVYKQKLFNHLNMTCRRRRVRSHVFSIQACFLVRQSKLAQQLLKITLSKCCKYLTCLTNFWTLGMTGLTAWSTFICI